MAENIKVSPSPIQRNEYDVAIELVNLHVSKEPVSGDEISELFSRYYALAVGLKSISRSSTILEFIPEEIRSKFNKR
ncbi:hypothetical protein [Metabacillus fastidiosus]|uniref:hypothetical protein n=1 Tax=Metabacillus fastidiosus TaxID=1458 RepID=UPI003D2C1012